MTKKEIVACWLFYHDIKFHKNSLIFEESL